MAREDARPAECPCVTAERPMCGNHDCFHFALGTRFQTHFCDLCKNTGYLLTPRAPHPARTEGARG